MADTRVVMPAARNANTVAERSEKPPRCNSKKQISVSGISCRINPVAVLMAV